MWSTANSGLALLFAVGAPSPTVPEVSWTAPARCPTRDELVELTERYAGQPIDTPRAEFFVAEATVTARADGFELSLGIRAGEGTTDELAVDENCAELTKLAALKIALALDPATWIDRADSTPVAEAAEAGPVPELKPETTETAVVVPRPADAPQPTPPVARTDLRGFLGMRGGGGWGVVPDLGGLGAVTGGLERESWRVSVHASAWAPTRTGVPSAQTSIRAWAAGGGLEACVVPRIGRVWFPLCAGPELLAVVARADGTPSARRRVRVLPSVTLAPSVELRWAAWSVFARPGLGVAISTPASSNTFLDASSASLAPSR